MRARDRAWFSAVGLLLLAAAYGPHLSGEFVWDDLYLIQQNTALPDPWGFWAILTRDTWAGAGHGVSWHYYPVSMLSYWLQARTGATSNAAYHLINALCHLACAGALGAELVYRRIRVGVALAVGWLFFVHPSGTEVVMWITERPHALASLFAFAALRLYREGACTPRGSAWAGAACAASFLCMENYVVVPAVLAASAALPGPEEVAPPSLGRRARMLVGPAMGIAAVFALRRALGIVNSTSALFASPLTHLVNYATLIAHYASQLLSASNGASVDTFVPLSGGSAALTLVVTALPVAGLAWAWRRGSFAGRGALLGVLWFLIALTPFVVAVPAVGSFGNRYAYLPLLGLMVALAYLLEGVLARAGVWGTRLALGAGAMALVACTVRTSHEAAYWHDSVVLFSRDVQMHPDDPRALFQLGGAHYLDGGCPAALEDFRRSAAAGPSFWKAWQNWAACLVEVGRPAEAVAPAQHAVELDPKSAQSLLTLGQALGAVGRREEARAAWKRAEALAPNDPDVLALGQALSDSGPRP